MLLIIKNTYTNATCNLFVYIIMSTRISNDEIRIKKDNESEYYLRCHGEEFEISNTAEIICTFSVF